jgi:hypothetical protein
MEAVIIGAPCKVIAKRWDLSSIWRKKRSVVVMYEDVKAPNSFVNGLTMSKLDKCNQEKWSKHYIHVALTILGIPA